MFWYLLLAHFIADYPLQTDWMVKNKQRWPVLGLHIAIHLGVMFLVVGVARQDLWPALLAIAAAHLLIDLGKNYANRLRPEWVIAPYAVDQLLHYLSIGWVALWIERYQGGLSLPITRSGVIYLLGYLLVTYVWFVSERILSYANTPYRQEVISHLWSRMVVRALVFSGFLLAWNPLSGQMPFAGLAFHLPYLSGKNSWRALLTDILVPLGISLFVRWALLVS